MLQYLNFQRLQELPSNRLLGDVFIVDKSLAQLRMVIDLSAPMSRNFVEILI